MKEEVGAEAVAWGVYSIQGRVQLAIESICVGMRVGGEWEVGGEGRWEGWGKGRRGGKKGR